MAELYSLLIGTYGKMMCRDITVELLIRWAPPYLVEQYTLCNEMHGNLSVWYSQMKDSYGTFSECSRLPSICLKVSCHTCPCTKRNFSTEISKHQNGSRKTRTHVKYTFLSNKDMNARTTPRDSVSIDYHCLINYHVSTISWY